MAGCPISLSGWGAEPAVSRGAAVVAPGRQPQSPAQREIDPIPDPLDLGTIHQLHSTILSLPRPALEGLTKAFRKRFQVPPEAPLIADRISQRRHHEWIEAFLVSHRWVLPAEPHQAVA